MWWEIWKFFWKLKKASVKQTQQSFCACASVALLFFGRNICLGLKSVRKNGSNFQFSISARKVKTDEKSHWALMWNDNQYHHGLMAIGPQVSTCSYWAHWVVWAEPKPKPNNRFGGEEGRRGAARRMVVLQAPPRRRRRRRRRYWGTGAAAGYAKGGGPLLLALPGAKMVGTPTPVSPLSIWADSFASLQLRLHICDYHWLT